MKKKTNLTILKKTIKNKYELIPFKSKAKNYKFIYPKYYSAYFNEWKNSIYSYNNKIMNLPVKTLNINQIVNSYFHMYFVNKWFIKSKRYIKKRKIRYFLKKIYVSKIGIKHTNSKAIVTLHILNVGKNSIKNKYKSIKKIFKKNNSNYFDNKTDYKSNIINYQSNFWKIRILLLKNLIKKFEHLSIMYSWERLENFKKKFSLRTLTLKNFFESNYLFLKSIILLLTINKITKIFKRKLRLFRKYEYIYSLNQFKYKKKLFLAKLSNKLSKIINKKIEFNLINLKSLTYSTDIFTEVLALKLSKKISKRKSRSNVYKNMKILLYKGKMPNIDRNVELREFDKTLTKNWVQNKYKNTNLFNVLQLEKNNTLQKLLLKMYYNNLFLKKINLNSWFLKGKKHLLQKKRNNIIFNSIKYKNLAGMKLEVKGRLTKRYRADRSVHKLYLKGRFNNLESSIKKLPSVVLRGYINNNLTYSMYKSKRRVGAFAVKGWISGK